MDCSGKPQDYDAFNMSECIPVNSVHVTQCYWDAPRFQYTLTIARPYGWVFGIPLQNRCSIGYLYNKDINTLDEVKEDVKNIFEQYNLTPSEHTNSFGFKNYTRKENFTDRIAYNGNSSFFLEPIEATSIATMDMLNRGAFDIWFNGKSPTQTCNEYTEALEEIEHVIMLHYFAGSIFKTPFWEYATERGTNSMRKAIQRDRFVNIINHSLEDIKFLHANYDNNDYGTWPPSSFQQNLLALNLYEKLKNVTN
jgi:tryptophan halogenase